MVGFGMQSLVIKRCIPKRIFVRVSGAPRPTTDHLSMNGFDGGWDDLRTLPARYLKTA